MGSRALSRKLLESTLKLHTPVLRFFPRVVNPTAAKFAAEAALLLGFNDLTDQFRVYANRKPNNWEFPQEERIWLAMTRVRDRSEIEQDHPFVDHHYFDKHLDPLPDGNVTNAFSDAEREYDRECLLLTLVVSNAIPIALDLSQHLSAERRSNVRFVATIEAFRTGDTELGHRLKRTLPSATMCEWGRPQMAVGITGRAAWLGYPYPDY